jgi:hypothetical protein
MKQFVKIFNPLTGPKLKQLAKPLPRHPSQSSSPQCRPSPAVSAVSAKSRRGQVPAEPRLTAPTHRSDSPPRRASEPRLTAPTHRHDARPTLFSLLRRSSEGEERREKREERSFFFSSLLLSFSPSPLLLWSWVGFRGWVFVGGFFVGWVFVGGFFAWVFVGGFFNGNLFSLDILGFWGEPALL